MSCLGYAFPPGRLEIHLVACAVIVVPYVINLRGIVFSNRIQLGMVAAMIALLVLVVAFSVASVKAGNFPHFFPKACSRSAPPRP